MISIHHAYPDYAKTLYMGDGRRVGSDVLGQTFKAATATPQLAAGEQVIVSPDGNELFVFNPQGAHLRTLDANTGGVRFQFSYDSHDRLAAITSGDGQITRMVRDASGALQSIVAPGGQTTAIGVGAAGYIDTIRMPSGATFKASYTDTGLMSRYTDAAGNERQYAFDDLGRLITAKNPLGDEKRLTRTNLAQGFEVNFRSAAGLQTTYRTESTTYGDPSPPEHLLKRTIVLPSGLAVMSLDDRLGHHSLASPDGTRMDLTTVPDPRWGTQSGVPAHRSISMPGGLVATSDIAQTVQLRNPSDPLSLISETLTSTSSGRRSTSVYDAASRITTHTSAAGRVSTTAFDTFGRLASRRVAGRAEVTAGYDSAGRLTKLSMGTGEASRTISFDYGTDGRLSAVVDPLGERVSFLYDADGRIIGQTMPDGKALAFTYDLNGNLASLTPPGRPPHSFTYSAESRLLRYVPPSIEANTAGTTYAYDQDARLAKVTRADGGTAELTYDAGGRLARLQVANGTVTYTRDSTTGNLASIAGPGTSTLR